MPRRYTHSCEELYIIHPSAITVIGGNWLNKQLPAHGASDFVLELLARIEPRIDAELAEEMHAGELNGHFFRLGREAVIRRVVLLADVAGWGCSFGELLWDKVPKFVTERLHLRVRGDVWVAVLGCVAAEYGLLKAAAGADLIVRKGGSRGRGEIVGVAVKAAAVRGPFSWGSAACTIVVIVS